MQLIYADRVKETSTTTGTGTYTLAGAVAGFQSFAAIGNGKSCLYVVEDGTNWEVGVGTYTSAGTTLSRDRILSSSNGGSAVNWAAGTRNVFVDVPANQLRWLAINLDPTYGISVTAQLPNIATGGLMAIGKNSNATASGAIAIGNSIASGVNSICIGTEDNDSASGAYAVSIGSWVVSGDFATVVGGLTSQAVGYCSRGGGAYAKARFASSDAWGLGELDTGVAGQAQREVVGLLKTTSNATPTYLELGGLVATYGRITLPANFACGFTGIVVGRSSTGDVAVKEVKGAFKTNGSGVPSLVGTPTVNDLGTDAGAAAWVVAVVANTTNNSLEIQVTGAAATTIKWLAELTLRERSA